MPAWEQIAATAALVTTLELVLFDAGCTAMWRTGPGGRAAPGAAAARASAEHEQLLGWLYVGGTDARADRTARADPDVTGKLTALSGLTAGPTG